MHDARDLAEAVEKLDQAIPKIGPVDGMGVGAVQHVQNIRGRLEGIRKQLARLADEAKANA